VEKMAENRKISFVGEFDGKQIKSELKDLSQTMKDYSKDFSSTWTANAQGMRDAMNQITKENAKRVRDLQLASKGIFKKTNKEDMQEAIKWTDRYIAAQKEMRNQEILWAKNSAASTVEWRWKKVLEQCRAVEQQQKQSNNNQVQNEQNLSSKLRELGLGRYATTAGILALEVKAWKMAFNTIVKASVGAWKVVLAPIKLMKDQLLKIANILVNQIVRGLSLIINFMKNIDGYVGALLQKFKSLSSWVDEYAGKLEVANNMIIQTFNEMPESVDRFAKGALRAYGITEQEAKKSVAIYATMAKSFGIAQNDAEEMAKTLTGLAADISIFYGEDMKDAMAQVKSVFTGETETLKNVGVILTEANLEAYMLKKNIRASYQEMDSASKTLLRYCYVMEHTQTAQGSFNKMSNTFYGQLRILQAQWESFMTSLSMAAAKVLTPLLQILTQIVINLKAMADVLNGLITEIFGLSSMLGATGDYSEMYEGIEESANGATGAVNRLKQILAGVDTINTLKDGSSGGGVGGIDTSSYEQLLEMMRGLIKYDVGDITQGIIKDTTWLKKALLWIKNRIDNIKNSLKKIKGTIDFSHLTNSLNAFIETFGKTIDKIASISIEEVFPWLVEDLLPLLVDIGEDALIVVNGILDSIDWNKVGNGIISVIEWVRDRASVVLNTIKNIIDNINLDNLKNSWNEFEPVLTGFIDWLIPKIGAIAQYFIENILPHLINIATYLLPLVQQIIDSIDWKAIGETITTCLENAANNIKTISEFLEKHPKLLETIGSILTSIISGLLNGKILLGFIQWTLMHLQGPMGILSNLAKKIGETISELIVGGLMAAKDLIDSLLTKLQDFLNGLGSIGDMGLGDAVGTVGDSVVKFGYYNPFNPLAGPLAAQKILSNLPQYANGGVLTQPTLNVAGEYPGASSNPEIITPQSLMAETIENTMGGYFGQMISLLNIIANKDNNTYLDSTLLTKTISKQQDMDNWRRR
jgi:hypothetical protein